MNHMEDVGSLLKGLCDLWCLNKLTGFYQTNAARIDSSLAQTR